MPFGVGIFPGRQRTVQERVRELMKSKQLQACAQCGAVHRDASDTGEHESDGVTYLAMIYSVTLARIIVPRV